MLAYTSILTAIVAFQGALALPEPTTTFLGTLPGDNKPCSTPVTTITTTGFRAICVPVCITPTSSCSPGEPTGPTPIAPRTSTIIPTGACTATVEVFNNPGCGNCPTCTIASAVEARATTMPGHEVCSATSTVTTTTGPQTTEICACPLALTPCASGEPTVKPLPTTTLLEGCVEEIIVGPGDCSNICPQCA